MADQKVSDLPSLNGADVDPADLLYIIDSSAGSAGSKKITVGQYQLAPVSGGTANGVLYLNGSKVATAGSDLVFDGTNLGIGTSSPAQKLHVNNTTGVNTYAAFSNSNATNGNYVGTAANGDGIIGTIDAKPLLFLTGATTRATLDASGNLGLGVTPSAWNSVYKAMDVGNSLSLIGGSLAADLYYNAFINSSGNFIYRAATSTPASAYSLAGGQHRWYTATSGTAGNAISFTQALTLDASGNLSVGTTAGGTRLQVFTATDNVEYFRAGTSAESRGIRFSSFIVSGTNGVGHLIDAPGASGVNGTLAFATNSTECARITSGGDFLVGTATSLASYRFQVASGSNSGGIFQTTAAGSFGATAWNTATSGDNLFFGMFTESTATQRGSIDYNRAGGLTRYNTTSDYRAKDIIGPVQNPGATIDALKVYEGVMKGATQSRPMLIAHEAQAVAPYAVSGVKDEVNEDGTPKFQQMDVSSLVPLLLAEIQSLRARVAALESA